MQITCPTCRNTFEAVTRRAYCEHCGAQLDVWAILSGHTGPLPEARNPVSTSSPTTAARAAGEPSSSGVSDPFSTTFVPASESVLDLPLTEIIPERSLEPEPVLDASFSTLPGEFVRAVTPPPVNSDNTTDQGTPGEASMAALTSEPGEQKRGSRAAWVAGVGALFIAAIAGTYYICETTHRGEAGSEITAATETRRPPAAIPEPSPASVLSASDLKASPPPTVGAASKAKSETQPLVPPPDAAPATSPDVSAADSATRARAVNPLAVGAGKYTLQIAAKPTEAEAKQLAEKLIDAGLDARILKANVPVAGTGEVKTWYRVRVGAFATKSDASQYGEQLKRGRSIDDYFIADMRK